MSDAGPYRRVTACRVCRSRSLSAVVSLGATPLANALVRPDDASRPEPRVPLEVVRCRQCQLVQLSVVVEPEAMFRHYLYATSASAPMVRHFETFASEIAESLAPPGALVVEIGSNDGVLLRPLAARGLRPLGIEPARNLADRANAEGLETWNEFFGPDVATRIRSAHGPASVVVANNVLAHIDDLAAVLEALDLVVGASGVLVAEVPYLADLIANVEYDTIYHEHLSYFSVRPLHHLLGEAGWELIDVRRMPTHGGSLRLFAARRGARPRSASVDRMLENESVLGLFDDELYDRFAARVARSRDSLRSAIGGLRAEGRTVAALGATAKGNTLLNYCGLTASDIAYVADSTPWKQGLLTPGAHIPIREERAIRDEPPDAILLLAWNYADEIVRRFGPYLSAGGRFIHPIPEARIITA